MRIASKHVTELLVSAQVPLRHYLWVPKDAITFTPHVLSYVFGDGRALFAFGTINSRPAYWIVRGDSSWTVEYDNGAEPSDNALEFGDISEEVLWELESEFGSASLGHDFEYNSAGSPYCPETGRLISEADIRYPRVNTGGGWHWCRLDWPDLPGIELVPHFLHPEVRVLAPRHSHIEQSQAA